jgi:hypothetical protein
MGLQRLPTLLWRLRLVVALVGFLAAVILFGTLLIGVDPSDGWESPLRVAFLTLWYSLMAIIALELLGCLVLLLLFIGRKTGLLNHAR